MKISIKFFFSLFSLIEMHINSLGEEKKTDSIDEAAMVVNFFYSPKYTKYIRLSFITLLVIFFFLLLFINSNFRHFYRLPTTTKIMPHHTHNPSQIAQWRFSKKKKNYIFCCSLKLHTRPHGILFHSHIWSFASFFHFIDLKKQIEIFCNKREKYWF